MLCVLFNQVGEQRAGYPRSNGDLVKIIDIIIILFLSNPNINVKKNSLD